MNEHSLRSLPAKALIAALMLAGPVHAEMSVEELAKLAENPVGNLISVPFQNNTNFNFGPTAQHSVIDGSCG